VQNTQWGALREKNMKPRLKPITSSVKQVIQRDGQKTSKDTKSRRGLSCCYNRSTQDGDGLNSLKRYILQNNEKCVLESFFQIFSMASKYIFQFLLQFKQ
jgi:hypothetical protein